MTENGVFELEINCIVGKITSRKINIFLENYITRTHFWVMKYIIIFFIMNDYDLGEEKHLMLSMVIE